MDTQFASLLQAARYATTLTQVSAVTVDRILRALDEYTIPEVERAPIERTLQSSFAQLTEVRAHVDELLALLNNILKSAGARRNDQVRGIREQPRTVRRGGLSAIVETGAWTQAPPAPDEEDR